MAKLTNALANAVAELEDDKIVDLVKTEITVGTPVLEIISKLQEGMNEVGLRFEAGEYFLSELILCGDMMSEAMSELQPFLQGTEQEYKGTVIIGTVKGDVHDLGKNIVVMLLQGAGYNVVDLGVDVPTEKFSTAIKEHNAPLVGMSVLLTGCQEAMRETISALRAEGLKTTILIGGNYVDEMVKEYVGADYFGVTASDAVKIANTVFAS